MTDLPELDDFEPICPTEDVPQHMPLRVEFRGRGVLLCREGDAIFALDELCPHENKPMRRGVIFNGEIVCPHHQYRFRLDTGRCNRRCAPVQTYRVVIADEKVWLSV